MPNLEIDEHAVRQCWNENADTWAEHVRKGWDSYREYFNNPAFLRFLGDVKGKTILDAGCGEGYNTRILARAGARMAGVDISDRMVDLAKESEMSDPLGIQYEVAPFASLSMFPDESFDAVVSTMALMDSPDFEGAISELHRVLKPECDLVFSILHPCFQAGTVRRATDEAGNTVGLVVNRYFSDLPEIERWKFSKAPEANLAEPFAVPRFPRTLSGYINPLMEAGFALQKVEEPRPTEDACLQHPWLRVFNEHAAMLLYVRARKV